MTQATVFEQVGGEAAFHALVRDFYAAVEEDPVLRPHYPQDLEPGKRHLAQFLAQYFGGGPIYSQHRGHPRLRMRHAPFGINQAARDRWMQLMDRALVQADLPPDVAPPLREFLDGVATFMINRE